MRVLSLTNTFPTLDQIYSGSFIHRQAMVLNKRDIEISVLHLDMRSIRKKRRYGFYKYQIENVDVYRCSFPCGPIPFVLEELYKRCLLFSVKKICEEIGHIDLIHAHFTVMGSCAAIVKKKLGIPIILTEHSSALIEKEITRKTIRQCTYAYKYADKIIAVGSNLAKHMKEYTQKKIAIVPNVLSKEFTIREKVDRNDQEFRYVSVVGKAMPDKRLNVLMSAFGKVIRKYPQSRLWIIGEGEIIEGLVRDSKNAGYSEEVKFLGVMSNETISEVYQNCDCFVLPSIKETFGMVYVEAAGCGLPIIGCFSGGTNDIITKKNGLFAKNDDIGSLESAMEYIMLHKDEYCSEEISAEVHQKFGEEKIASQLIKLYQEILAGGCE